MPKKLPVVILWDDVLFPSTIKEIVLDKDYNLRACELAQKAGGEVLVVGVRDSNRDTLSIDKILNIGVLCEVVELLELNDSGTRKVRARFAGKRRVRMNNLTFDKKSTKNIWIGEYSLVKTSKTKHVQVFIDQYTPKNADSTKKTKSFVKMMQESQGNLEEVIDQIANSWPKGKSGVESLKKTLLCEPSLFTRLQILLSVEMSDESIEVSLGKKDKEEEISNLIDERITKQVSKNISRQQKEFYLREKLKVIKEELGDSSSKEVEIRKFKSQLRKGKYPQNVIDRAQEEIQRFEMCPSYSNEATVIRSYLDWLLNLPWMYVSQDEMDLKKVKKVLDSNHYGLEKIKDRIIEFLAVKKKSSKETGTIICFVGPPGVGKTSLAKSISEALNKRFVKISLGGLYDESELRGHRKTYVASMPGKIIRALRQAKVKNPVFLLDEIDKISSGYHGDPIHALLEILDPKQNVGFNDHYLEEDFDLSKVMFIATANYDENIPDPLWDRMEIIHLRTYTEEEKLNIAKSHLVPEVLDSCGLTTEELSFTDEAIRFIIQRYTREAGVRSLKKQIEKITRKVVKGMIVDDKTVKVIDNKEVREYLEYELFDVTKKDEESIPGIVNGMAYTDFGGDLLPIEVNHVTGKGTLSLTGNLRDTMKESAAVALAYVRANEEQFGLKDKNVDWNNIDVNLHVPTGGTPKDGPSAGVTITTALISSFSGKPVSSRVAMTGEITLRGKVLPIGGLREKVISAVRGGIDTIFYPDENTKNLVDIPDEIKKSIRLIPVKHYTQIFESLF